MDIYTRQKLEEFGFTEFSSIQDLRINLEIIPPKKGVYMVIRDSNDDPEFLEKGTGGEFKKKKPNVPFEKLMDKWVKGAFILYIGETGGYKKRRKKKDGEKRNHKKNRFLRSRIKELLDFGQGKSVGHYGGRLIWQLKDAENLFICWKEFSEKNDDPKKIKQALINQFKKTHDGKLPFANLR